MGNRILRVPVRAMLQQPLKLRTRVCRELGGIAFGRFLMFGRDLRHSHRKEWSILLQHSEQPLCPVNPGLKGEHKEMIAGAPRRGKLQSGYGQIVFNSPEVAVSPAF